MRVNGLIIVGACFLAGCASQQIDYVQEAQELNPVEVCYVAHYNPYRFYNKSRAAIWNMARGDSPTQDAESRKNAAIQIIKRDGIYCDLIELAKLHEMRMQTQSMNSSDSTPTKATNSGFQNKNGDLTTRCTMEGKTPNFSTGGCM